MHIEDLKAEVAKLLVTKHDFLDMDEATTHVEESVAKDPRVWHEDANPEDLANYLAESDDDD